MCATQSLPNRRSADDTTSSLQGGVSKRQKTERKRYLSEIDALVEARRYTFSHYPGSNWFKKLLIDGGFFFSNYGDNVLCIYCHLSCEHWNPFIDNPFDIHRIRSPECLIVKAQLNLLNETKSKAPAVQRDYFTLEQRRATFPQSSSLVEKLAQAGFFLRGDQIVCFCCHGLLPSNSLTCHLLVEHVRSFPTCPYARHMCGETLYNLIQLIGLEDVSSRNPIVFPRRE